MRNRTVRYKLLSVGGKKTKGAGKRVLFAELNMVVRFCFVCLSTYLKKVKRFSQGDREGTVF